MTLLLNNFSGERVGKNYIIKEKKAHFSLKFLKYFKKLIYDFQLHIEYVIFLGPERFIFPIKFISHNEPKKVKSQRHTKFS